jgi:hypothetical protein
MKSKVTCIFNSHQCCIGPPEENATDPGPARLVKRQREVAHTGALSLEGL